MITTTNATLVLDGLLLLGLLLYAVEGYRRGFVRTVGGAVGFVVGGLLGLRFAPAFVEAIAPQLAPIPLLVALVGLVLFAALIGQAVVSGITRRILPVRTAALGRIDALLGSVVSLVLAAGIVWLGAGLLRTAVPAAVADVVDDSRVLRTVDDLAPVSKERALQEVSDVFARYEFPRVFEGEPERMPPVEAADPAIADNAAIARAGASVVRIDATARQCGRMQEGSGFVVGPGLVVTNAHVVTGSDAVRIRKDGLRSTAEVVAFDPGRDLAVLAADTGDLTPIPLADSDLRRGSEAIIAGYPLGGPYTAHAGRVRDLITAQGRDIYYQDRVVRKVYGVRAGIKPGNSGGPLLTTDGSVAGVVFARSLDDEGTAYALRLAELRPVLETAQARETVAVGGCTAA
ncbi:MarP family serine protease [Mobilicoccus caccae]|uniref:Membrane-associated serine protease n=1 Tax=Mobilicoccus caccae TaxID=1859295 RepID=A0ABQ6INH9_9MICO|nr:MarP family serine protease [Mobilicoccus caccae]GMA38287.1 putative membrane-associated serine protease [Mobilicoccus caccae]